MAPRMEPRMAQRRHRRQRMWGWQKGRMEERGEGVRAVETLRSGAQRQKEEGTMRGERRV